jgi:hypothetical protein
MLVNCPKCGFSQPKDQYCANCGVNMQQFKPKAPSLLLRAVTSPLSFLLVASLVAAGSWYFIQQKQLVLQKLTSNQDADSGKDSGTGAGHRSAASPGADENASKDAAMTGSSTAGNSGMQASTNSMPAASSFVPGTVSNANMPSASPDGNATNSTTNPSNANLNENENHRGILVKIYYAEVDRKTLANFIDESQNLGQFLSLAEMKAGVLQQLKQKLQISGVRILHKIDRRFDSQQLSHHWFFGKKAQDPEMDQGFATLLSLSDVEMLPLRAELEIGRALRESEGTVLPARRSYPLSFELQKGQAFYVSGILPHRDLMELNEELSSIQVFRLFKSPNFLKGDSELTIFFEFEKNSP